MANLEIRIVQVDEQQEDDQYAAVDAESTVWARGRSIVVVREKLFPYGFHFPTLTFGVRCDH